MVNKENNLNKASMAKDIATKYNLENIQKNIEDFIMMNESYKAHILLIGGYSAGKSALLNKYIGKNILIEDQGPQTNIATELLFSEDERIIVNTLLGDKKRIYKTDEVNVDYDRNIECYINSENLKGLNDYIIVDMDMSEDTVKFKVPFPCLIIVQIDIY